MANIKIQQLTNKASPDSTDVFIIEDSVSTKKITYENLKEDIVQSGSTSNSSWVRLGDGTQICWLDLVFTGSINIGYGSLFRAESSVSWTYPKSFLNNPVTSITGESFYSPFGYVIEATGYGLSFYPVAPISSSDREYFYSIVAIGRWK